MATVTRRTTAAAGALALAGVLTGVAQAQGAGAGAAAGAGAIPPAAQQIAAAVLPLPASPPELRAGATVLGYDAAGKLVTLRQGTNDMVCLADDPKQERFHVACYHNSLEPFMARGRALRERGLGQTAVDSARFAEIDKGTLPMPKQAAALYQMSGPPNSFDAAAGTAAGARALYVVYLPFATSATTGLPTRPQGAGVPWLMNPGTAKAHIMLTPTM